MGVEEPLGVPVVEVVFQLQLKGVEVTVGVVVVYELVVPDLM